MNAAIPTPVRCPGCGQAVTATQVDGWLLGLIETDCGCDTNVTPLGTDLRSRAIYAAHNQAARWLRVRSQ